MERLFLDEMKMTKKLDQINDESPKQVKTENNGAILTSIFEEFAAKISSQLETI